MDTQKNLFILFGEWLQARQARRCESASQSHVSRPLTAWLPTRGNVMFTLAMIALLIAAQSVGALPLGQPLVAPEAASTGTIAYQGRLADAAGKPLTGTYSMIFRLYTVATGGTPLWTEQWTGSNGVRVSDGLFNVMLGSLTPIPTSLVTNHASLFLGITVGTDDEMQPRVQLGSVPFAVQALTVPNGSVTTAKIADGAVTQAKLSLDRLGIGTTNPQSQIEVKDLSSNHVALTLENADTRAGIELENEVATSPGEAILNFGVGTGRGISPKPDNVDQAWFRIDTRQAWKGFAWMWKKPDSSSTVTIMSLSRDGDFAVSGTKSSVVASASYGQRKLYAVEAPDVRFSDEGIAHLQVGMARVELNPIFLETIEGEYLVHVTSYGDASLYVAEIGQDYFVVKVREGDPNVAFAWRLSATRKGYAGVRLEEVK